MKLVLKFALAATLAVHLIGSAAAQGNSPLQRTPILDDRAIQELRSRIGRAPQGFKPRPGRGCTLYEHVGYKGAHKRLTAGQAETGPLSGEDYVGGRYVFFGNDWNDRASSATCDTACGALLYEHRDMKGKWMPMPAAGFGQLNDAFSSAVVFCRTN